MLDIDENVRRLAVEGDSSSILQPKGSPVPWRGTPIRPRPDISAEPVNASRSILSLNNNNAEESSGVQQDEPSLESTTCMDRFGVRRGRCRCGRCKAFSRESNEQLNGTDVIVCKTCSCPGNRHKRKAFPKRARWAKTHLQHQQHQQRHQQQCPVRKELGELTNSSLTQRRPGFSAWAAPNSTIQAQDSTAMPDNSASAEPTAIEGFQKLPPASDPKCACPDDSWTECSDLKAASLQPKVAFTEAVKTQTSGQQRNIDVVDDPHEEIITPGSSRLQTEPTGCDLFAEGDSILRDSETLLEENVRDALLDESPATGDINLGRKSRGALPIAASEGEIYLTQNRVGEGEDRAGEQAKQSQQQQQLNRKFDCGISTGESLGQEEEDKDQCFNGKGPGPAVYDEVSDANQTETKRQSPRSPVNSHSSEKHEEPQNDAQQERPQHYDQSEPQEPHTTASLAVPSQRTDMAAETESKIGPAAVPSPVAPKPPNILPRDSSDSSAGLPKAGLANSLTGGSNISSSTTNDSNTNADSNNNSNSNSSNNIISWSINSRDDSSPSNDGNCNRGDFEGVTRLQRIYDQAVEEETRRKKVLQAKFDAEAKQEQRRLKLEEQTKKDRQARQEKQALMLAQVSWQPCRRVVRRHTKSERDSVDSNPVQLPMYASICQEQRKAQAKQAERAARVKSLTLESQARQAEQAELKKIAQEAKQLADQQKQKAHMQKKMELAQQRKLEQKRQRLLRQQQQQEREQQLKERRLEKERQQKQQQKREQQQKQQERKQKQEQQQQEHQQKQLQLQQLEKEKQEEEEQQQRLERLLRQEQLQHKADLADGATVADSRTDEASPRKQTSHQKHTAGEPEPSATGATTSATSATSPTVKCIPSTNAEPSASDAITSAGNETIVTKDNCASEIKSSDASVASSTEANTTNLELPIIANDASATSATRSSTDSTTNGADISNITKVPAVDSADGTTIASSTAKRSPTRSPEHSTKRNPSGNNNSNSNGNSNITSCTEPPLHPILEHVAREESASRQRELDASHLLQLKLEAEVGAWRSQLDLAAAAAGIGSSGLCGAGGASGGAGDSGEQELGEYYSGAVGLCDAMLRRVTGLGGTRMKWRLPLVLARARLGLEWTAHLMAVAQEQGASNSSDNSSYEGQAVDAEEEEEDEDAGEAGVGAEGKWWQPLLSKETQAKVNAARVDCSQAMDECNTKLTVAANDAKPPSRTHGSDNTKPAACAEAILGVSLMLRGRVDLVNGHFANACKNLSRGRQLFAANQSSLGIWGFGSVATESLAAEETAAELTRVLGRAEDHATANRPRMVLKEVAQGQ